MTDKTTNAKKGVLLVLGTAVISGIAIFINSLFITNIDPSYYTFLKNSLCALALLSIILASSKFASYKNFNELKKLTKKDWGSLLIIGLIGGAVPFLLFFEGLAMSSGTTGALIHKSMFLFAAVFAVLFLKEKIDRKIFPLALLIFAGIFLLLSPDLSSMSYGHLLILSATLFWAGENTFSKHLLKNLSGTTVALGRMFFGSIFILIYLALTGQIFGTDQLSGTQWIQVLLASLFLTGYVLTWYNGLKHIPVSLATSILLLGLPVTIFANFIFLEQVIPAYQIIGSLLIMLGLSGWIYVVIGKKKTFPTALKIFKALKPLQRHGKHLPENDA